MSQPESDDDGLLRFGHMHVVSLACCLERRDTSQKTPTVVGGQTEKLPILGWEEEVGVIIIERKEILHMPWTFNSLFVYSSISLAIFLTVHSVFDFL